MRFSQTVLRERWRSTADNLEVEKVKLMAYGFAVGSQGSVADVCLSGNKKLLQLHAKLKAPFFYFLFFLKDDDKRKGSRVRDS